MIGQSDILTKRKGLAAAALSLLLLDHAPAAEPATIVAPIGDAGQAYVEAVGNGRADTEVTYFDPAKPPPELTLDPRLQDRPDATETWEGGWLTGLIAALLLVGVIGVMVMVGGLPSVSLGQAPRLGRRTARDAPTPGPAPAVEEPLQLSRIRQIGDRRKALATLCREALDRASRMNGFRLGRSWTARDTLSRIPSDWPCRTALADLVRAAELAHFGGRDVSEAEFEAQVDTMRPIFASDAVSGPAS